MTFKQFIKIAKKQNVYGDSPEGDFVDDVYRDKDFRDDFTKWDQLSTYLLFKSACPEAISTARDVFRDWRKREKSQSRNISPKLRYQILARDNFKCQTCGRNILDGVALEIDHKIPVSRGGTNSQDNLQALCSECNIGKSNSIL